MKSRTLSPLGKTKETEQKTSIFKENILHETIASAIPG